MLRSNNFSVPRYPRLPSTKIVTAAEAANVDASLFRENQGKCLPSLESTRRKALLTKWAESNQGTHPIVKEAREAATNTSIQMHGTVSVSISKLKCNEQDKGNAVVEREKEYNWSRIC